MSKTPHGYNRSTATRPETEHLIYEEDGDVATITLNRPEVMNALSIDLSREFTETLEYIRDQEHLHIVVLKGAGGNFCTGDDLTEMAAGKWGHPNQVFRRVRYYQYMANTLEELDKITIASVDGNCVGGGLEVTMACDFVICTERARWGMPEVDWGITPGWGGTTRMVRLIGRRMTKEINLLGALHPAKRGVDLGLFNRVVGNDELEAATQELVELLQMKNHQGLRQLKFIINKNVEADLNTAQGFEALQTAYTSSVNQTGAVADADDRHGWASYVKKDPESPIAKRRTTSIDFWVD
ncbi:enoyl-CoA hydratase/isomerase family protein [uncultured Erythrobacter sp.]|uniref:enoyl-CoA hydratase/isomerase family protein n=1 Tax=uncultured Erythrobacter sp. TaxID=263913 RepID=UPI0026380A64|nr:enoyl-CoA hydratase/isomerase family protein [uncultured Erythrobacter sp.]